MKTTIEIRSRLDDIVLYSHECDENTMKLTLEAAVRAGAYLGYAYLFEADLGGANLTNAYLSCANLSGADLFRANLGGADLSGANLFEVHLSGANMRGAKFDNVQFKNQF